MFKNRSNTNLLVALTVAVSAWAIGSKDASAQGAHSGHEHGAHAAHNPDRGSAARPGRAPMARRSARGGQMTMTGPYSFEVVYRPKETRIYLYDVNHRPIRARGVQGQVALKVRGNDKVYRYPLKHVGPQAGSQGHDYLAMAVNVSRIKDGDMSATFELANLPNPQQPRATFTQTFALSKLPVTVALLDASDAPRIDRQKVCVVTGGKLGSMGTPIKVLIGGQPIYLCCKGCLAKVQAKPDFYLQKVAPAGLQPNATASAGRIMVTTATAADQTAIARQRVCAVSGGKLGSMGTPVKITAGGQSLFVCCKGCIGKVEKNPQHYLAKAAQLRAGR